MLSADDIERILDVAQEFDVVLEVEEIERQWEEYVKNHPDSDPSVPFDNGELVDRLKEMV